MKNHLPLILLQINVAIGFEMHALTFEKLSLFGPIGCQSSHAIHHPMTRNGCIGDPMEGISHMAGMQRKACKMCNLAVGEHTSTWNLADDIDDFLSEKFGIEVRHGAKML